MNCEEEKSSVYLEDNFFDRRKQLSAQLDQVEKSLNKHNNHQDSRVPNLDELSRVQQSRKLRGFRGRQSIFKRPEGPAPRSNVCTIPDYRRNPSKWTCYSLDDVSEMSNESNSQAAFSFLKELRQRKRQESKKLLAIKDKLKSSEHTMEVVSGCASKSDSARTDEDTDMNEETTTSISFKKPQKKKEIHLLDAKPEFRNNKIVMPEYEVGSKKAPKKKKWLKSQTEKIDKNKEIRLGHLNEYEDGEE